MVSTAGAVDVVVVEQQKLGEEIKAARAEIDRTHSLLHLLQHFV